MINIVFYKIEAKDYYYDMEILEESFIGSIRIHMPDAIITQLSDVDSAEVKGVDKIIRYPRTFGSTQQTVHYDGFKYLSELDIESILLTDTDMLYNANVEHLFEGDFEVAACRRGGGSGLTRRSVNINFPYPSIIVSKNPQFWKDCSTEMFNLHRRRWTDNMWAVGEVIRSGKYKFKHLDGYIYNRMPVHEEDFDSNAKVFHFKSRGDNDRKDFMNYFYETHIKTKGATNDN